MKQAVHWLEQLALVIFTLSIALLVLVLINNALFDYRNILFRTGDIGTYLLVGGFLMLLSYTLKKLLVWQVHAEFKPRRKR